MLNLIWQKAKRVLGRSSRKIIFFEEKMLKIIIQNPVFFHQRYISFNNGMEIFKKAILMKQKGKKKTKSTLFLIFTRMLIIAKIDRIRVAPKRIAKRKTLERRADFSICIHLGWAGGIMSLSLRSKDTHSSSL